MENITELFKTMAYVDNTLIHLDAAKIWMMKNGLFGPFCNGSWVIDKNEKPSHLFLHPEDEKVVTKVYAADTKVIEGVRQLATSETHVVKREKAVGAFRFLQSIADGLEKNADLFAQVEFINRNIIIKNTLEYDIPEMTKYFTYYSNVAYKAAEDNACWKPKRVTLGILSKNMPLVSLAWLLAPAFASQTQVVLYIPYEIALSVMLFVNKCIEGTDFRTLLTVLPGNEAMMHELVTYKDFATVICFGSSHVYTTLKEVALSHNVDREYAAVHHGKSAMIVFASADVDAAVRSAVKALCLNQSVLPWALKHLIVEESVFKSFFKKFEKRFRELCATHPCAPGTDIGAPFDCNNVRLLADKIETMRRIGAEVYHLTLKGGSSCSSNEPPTVLVGGVHDDVGDAPVFTLIVDTFRTIQEATTLVDKMSNALAVSVWCNDLALALTVINRLQVGTVWVNTHGKFHPAVPVQGWNGTAVGEFGGFSGLIRMFKDEFIDDNELTTLEHKLPQWKMNCEPGRTYNLFYGGGYKTPRSGQGAGCEKSQEAMIAVAQKRDIELAVAATLSAQESWARATHLVRSKCLHKMAECLRQERHLLESVFQADEINSSLNFVLEELHIVASESGTRTDTVVHALPFREVVRITNEPMGVIGLVITSKANNGQYLIPLFRILLTALSCGNSVVVALDVQQSMLALEVFKIIVEAVPTGVLTILTGHADEVFIKLSKCTTVNYIWYPCGSKESLKIQQCLSCTKECCFNVPRSRGAVARRVSQQKSVWMMCKVGVC